MKFFVACFLLIFFTNGAVADAAAAESPAGMFTAEGIVADRGAGTVRVEARLAGTGAGDIAEFIVITENSGHDYEALFVAKAAASNIVSAMEFLGVPKGAGIDYDKFRFWARGERVKADIVFPGQAPVPLDSLILDVRGGKPVEPVGFVYVGFGGADSSGPGSIISTYNEAETVFDVPRNCVQGEVYEKFRVAGGFPTNKEMMVEIVFTPERRAGAAAGAGSRVMDVALGFSTNGVAVGDAAAVPLAEAGARLRELVAEGRDVFAALSWDDGLSIGQVRDFCRFLKLLDVDSGVRVAAPAESDPYYKAFVPPDEWRERANRFAQPCELRFAADGAATLVAITEVWTDGELKPELKVAEFPGVTVETLPQVIKGKDNELKVLLVFAPEGMLYGALRPFVAAMREGYPNIHVFTVD